MNSRKTRSAGHLFIIMLVSLTCASSALLAQPPSPRVEVSISDSLGPFTYNPPLTFGLDPFATNCVDEPLGEFFMFTECGLFSQRCAQFYFPFSDACPMSPVFLDLRPSYDPAQIDTFAISVLGTPPIVLHWQAGLGNLFESCVLYEFLPFVAGIPPTIEVDMTTTDSAVISTTRKHVTVVVRTAGPRDLTGVRSQMDELPAFAELSGNYPNPFNPATTFWLALGRLSAVYARVYDMTGRMVSILNSSTLDPGRHQLSWDGTNMDGDDVSSGTYFLRVSVTQDNGADFRVLVRKMALMR